MPTYEITAPDGKTYQIDGPEGASQDEVAQAVMSAYPEAGSPAQAAPQAVPQANAPVAAPTAAPVIAPQQHTTPTVVQGLNPQEDFTFDPQVQAQIDAAAADANVPYDQYVGLVKQKMEEAGQPFLGAGTQEELDQYRKFIAEGGSASSVGYRRLNPAEFLGDYNQQEDTQVGGLGAALEEGMAYNPMGIATRFIQDWTDADLSGGVSKETIRQRYPDLTDDQVEGIHDLLLGEERRRELLNAGAQVDYKDVSLPVRLAANVVGGASPIDIIPAGRGASLGARLAEGAAYNAAIDAAMQGQDVAYGAQDGYDYGQTAMAATGGAALQGGLEAAVRGAGAIANRVSPPKAAPSLPAITRTTVGKRNKAYKGQINQAIEDTTAFINTVTQDWTNAPEFEVHQNFTKLPGVDNDALGTITPEGKVLINVENIAKAAQKAGVGPEDVTTALWFHEALGHYGMTQKFGEELDYQLEKFYDDGSKSFQANVDKWLEKHPKAYVGDPNRKARAVDEVLAEMSERGQIPVAILDRLKNSIKKISREIGLYDFKYSRREVKAILGMAHDAVINGKGRDVASNGYRYATVYHGSGADFDAFDHSKMGTGEGAQVYGWGTYLTDTKKIAEGYQRAIGGEVPSWNGVEGDWYTTRNNMKEGVSSKFGDKYLSYIDNILNDTQQWGDSFPTSARKAAEMHYFQDDIDLISPRTPEDWARAYQAKETWIAEMQPILDYVNKNLTTKRKGKLYEVDIPDNAFYLNWDEPIKGTDAEQALKQAGFEVLDYDDWNYIERQYYEAKSEYDQTVHQLSTYEDYIKNEQQYPGVERPEDIARYEAEADRLFQELQKIAPRYSRLREEYKSTLHEDMTGEDVYGTLAMKLGSPQKASEALKDAGFTGNKYLDGFSRNKGDGSYNYVIFDDKTPKITAKYMKEFRQQDADELFESQNAFDILDELTKDYKPVTMSMDDIKTEAELRGLSLSQILKSKEINLGELPRRFVMQDIAADKLNERVTNLYNKIQSGQGTYKDRVDHAQSLLKFKELSARIFDEQGEAGRLLRTIQELSYTRKKITGLRDTLENFTAQGLDDILNDPDMYLRFAKEIQDQLSEAKKANKPSMAARVLNIPRAIMSSMDVSGAFRQGLFLVGRPEFWKSLPSMFKYLASKEAYDDLMIDITKRDTYSEMTKSNLQFSSMDGKLSTREEDFQTDLAEKIPVLGAGIRASNRAYAGFLNKLRADVFDNLYKEAQSQGVDVGDSKFLKDLGSFISHATGRGTLPGVLKSSAPLLNAMFFSPRLMASRAQLLNPQYYATLDPFVRKQAITSLLSATGFVSTILGLAAVGGAEVELDPRSSDFGKIKVGNTRYDIGGGFLQYITLGSRILSTLYNRVAPESANIGEYKTSMGDLKTYGNKFGERNLWNAVEDFFYNKLSPVPSFGRDVIRDSNFIGEPVELVGDVGGVPVPGSSIRDRFIPMFVQDVVETVEEYGLGEGLLRAAPGAIGVSVQDYSPPALNYEDVVEAPDTFDMEDLEDGENDLIKVEGGKVTLKGDAKAEWESRLNFYIQEWMKDEISNPEWETMTDKEKAEIIKSVRDDARKQTKQDMLPLLGIEE